MSEKSLIVKKPAILALFLIFVSIVVFWRLSQDKIKRPHLVLITLDTTRLDHLSCYGYSRKTAPNLEKLATDGQLFQRAYAVSSWTLPTHASIFTGLYPSTHGAHYAESGALGLDIAVDVGDKDLYQTFKANGLAEEAVTMAEVLKSEGYKTGGVGSSPWLKKVFGMAQGFDCYNCDVNNIGGRRGDEVTTLGLSFIQNRGESPFFLFLNYFDPHYPYQPPPEYVHQFFPREKLKELRTDPEAAKAFQIAQYDSEIFFMDLQIGRFLQGLKKAKLYENSLIVVMGDHGELFDEHGLMGHGSSLFEPEVRCPLIIKWPKGWALATGTDQICLQTDILPTLIQRMEINRDLAFEGQPLGEGAGRIPVSELYKNRGMVQRGGSRFDRNLTAVYLGDYKRIFSTRKKDLDAGLFNVKVDPQEQANLIFSENKISAQMEKLLKDWKKNLKRALPEKKIKGVDPKTKEMINGLGYPP